MDCAPETGVTIFKLARSMDSGPVLLSVRTPIAPDDDYGALLEKCAGLGSGAFVKFADENAIDSWKFTPQGDKATLAPKVAPEEERIDWSAPASGVSGKIRALSPSPGAWTVFRGKRLAVLSAREATETSASGRPGEIVLDSGAVLAHSGYGMVELTTVRPEGKRALEARDWSNGARISRGECFS
jgi:methionyl-tRNA formyltransferase